MTLREVLANRARRKMRELRESRESKIRFPRHRRLIESLEERRQNRFIESREATRRNHYILVENENEDDLVEIEPAEDTSVSIDITADAPAVNEPVEKEDVVKTLSDLAAQLGYQIVPDASKAEEQPVKVSDETPVVEPIAATEPTTISTDAEQPEASEDDLEKDDEDKAPEVEENKECESGKCKEATETPVEETKPVKEKEVTAEADKNEKETSAEGDEQPAEEEKPAADEGDEETTSTTDGEEKPAADEGDEETTSTTDGDESEASDSDGEENAEDSEKDPEEVPEDAEGLADLLSNIPETTWRNIVDDILSGKSEN